VQVRGRRQVRLQTRQSGCSDRMVTSRRILPISPDLPCTWLEAWRTVQDDVRVLSCLKYRNGSPQVYPPSHLDPNVNSVLSGSMRSNARHRTSITASATFACLINTKTTVAVANGAPMSLYCLYTARRSRFGEVLVNPFSLGLALSFLSRAFPSLLLLVTSARSLDVLVPDVLPLPLLTTR
jgi:hypothetical protein